MSDELSDKAVIAIEDGDLNELIKLHSAGWNPAKLISNKIGNSLHHAVVSDANAEVVDWLCETGVDVNKSYDAHNIMPPLHLACYNGNKAAMRSLISFKANAKQLWNGVTPIMSASIGGHFDLVKGLCAQEPSALHQVDAKGIPSSLHAFNSAVKAKDSDMLKWLESKDVDLSHPWAIYSAIKHNFKPAIRGLISRGSCLNDAIKTSIAMSSTTNQNDVLKRVNELGGDFNYDNGRPLVMALYYDFDDTLINQLLRNGADINHSDGAVLKTLANAERADALERAVKFGGDLSCFSMDDKDGLTEGVLELIENSGRAPGMSVH